MFDKHDVTTKKFDDILKRVSWVDNLYAVWMSGYRLQLEAFRVKLNSVAEMLNPAMLALNPEKYAAKMEAINTVYQNVKESREQFRVPFKLMFNILSAFSGLTESNVFISDIPELFTSKSI